MSVTAGVSEQTGASSSDVSRKLRYANQLWAEAHEHAQLAKEHHQKARNRFKKFEVFKRELEALGVKVILEKPQSPRRQSDRSGDGNPHRG